MSSFINMGPLFGKRKWPEEEFDYDITANRHKCNPNSEKAFKAIKDRLTEREQEVYQIIKENDGLTAEEIADIMCVTVNAISGRCSTLRHVKHKIYKSGTRLTRSGHPAAILKAV